MNFTREVREALAGTLCRAELCPEATASASLKLAGALRQPRPPPPPAPARCPQKRGAPPPEPKTLAPASQAQGEAFASFYRELVGQSAGGLRWAGSPGEAGGDAAGGAAVIGPQPAPAAAHDAAAVQALDRATVTPAGVVILEPRRAEEAGGPTAGTEEWQHEPEAPAHPQHESSVAPQYGISRRNVGYQLLKKAGWSEGTGLGAQEQGRREPLAPAAVLGQTGLGFQSTAQRGRGRQAQRGESERDAPGPPGQQADGGSGPQPGAQQQQQAQQPKRPLPGDPLEKEDTTTKVKRVKQVCRMECV